MIRTLLVSLGTLSVFAASSLFAGNATPVTTAPQASVHDARVESGDRVDDVIAAAVIGSISRQFDARDVTVQLERVSVTPASIQDRQVDGRGRLRIDGDAEWLPFEFAGLYDMASAEVTYPRLQLGDARSAADVSTGSSLARSFDRQITQALAAEFQSQQVHWTLAHASAAGSGRFIRFDGRGTADFGADGSSLARVEGVYDTRAGRWLRVHYELGGEADSGVGPSVATL